MIKNVLLLVDYIASPGGKVKEIKASGTGLFSFLVFAAAIFTQSLSNQLLNLNSGSSSLTMLLLDVFSNLIAGCLTLFIFTLWVHFMADFMNKISSATAVMKVCCMSAAPLVLCLPVALFLVAWTKKPLMPYYIIYFLILIKVIQLLFVGLRDSFHLNSKETVIIFVAPFIIIPVVCTLLLVIVLMYVFTVFV